MALQAVCASHEGGGRLRSREREKERKSRKERRRKEKRKERREKQAECKYLAGGLSAFMIPPGSWVLGSHCSSCLSIVSVEVTSAMQLRHTVRLSFNVSQKG